jgi:hypothetical protein
LRNEWDTARELLNGIVIAAIALFFPVAAVLALVGG